MSVITTASGRHVRFVDPDPDTIVLDDIAGALSRICRFGGHVSTFYSVAQHSVLVADIVATRGGDRDARRWALMHDASEAYLGDVVTPLKRLLGGYAELERQALAVIADRFRLPRRIPDVVLYADRVALHAEARDLCHARGDGHAFIDRTLAPWVRPVVPLAPVDAEAAWRHAWADLEHGGVPVRE